MNTTIRNENEKINIDDIIIPHAALKPYTSYRTGGDADFLCIPENLEQLKVVLKFASEQHLPVTILGAGSNVLISDDGVEGLVILTHKMKAYHIRGLLCVAECGLTLDTLINVAIENNLSGLEPLGGLPGTIGGAVWGNSGTHDITITDYVEWVDYLDKNGQLFRYYPLNESSDYRNSFFKENSFTIYEVALRLHFNKNTSLARQKKEESRLKRLHKGQYDLPSAGCMFKNPEGKSAGRLIEEAGCKDQLLNGAMVSHHHANFIVKTSQETTSRDIYTLSEEVRKKVKEKHSIDLEREVNLIGRW